MKTTARFASVPHRATSWLLTLALALPMAACGPLPEEDGDPAVPGIEEVEGIEGSQQGLTSEEMKVIFNTGSAYLGYASTAYNVINWFVHVNDTVRDPLMEIDQLRRQMQFLEEKIDAMSSRFEKRLDAVEMSGRDNTVIAERAHAMSALDYARMGNDTVSMAHGAARVLEMERYYLLTPRDPDGTRRFDPRVTAISFMEVVTTWLAIQALRKVPLSQFAKSELTRFASRLDWVAGEISQRVVCMNKVMTTHPTHMEKGHVVRKTMCFAQDVCDDSLDDVHDWNTPLPPRPRSHAGACTASELQHNKPNPERAYRTASSRYFLDIIEQTSALWKQLAAS